MLYAFVFSAKDAYAAYEIRLCCSFRTFRPLRALFFSHLDFFQARKDEFILISKHQLYNRETQT
jgi:hypothetical protein